MIPGSTSPGRPRTPGRPARFPDQHRLFEEGGTADRFWLIQAGQVTLDTVVPGRGRVIIGHLGRGDVLGLSWLFPPYRWGFPAMRCFFPPRPSWGAGAGTYGPVGGDFDS